MTNRRSRIAMKAVCVAGPLLFSAWACSPSTGSNNNHDSLTPGDPNAGGASNASSGGSSQGSSPGSGGDTGIINVESGGTSSNGLADGGCFAVGSKTEHVTTTEDVTVDIDIVTYKPFDMFIMYDQSGSMDQGNPNKWDAIKAALIGFANDTANADVGMGIGYFPKVNPAAPPFCAKDADCGTFGPCVLIIPAPLAFGYCQGADACQVSEYATPDVPIELLSTGAPKIVASVNAHSPNGGTPTAPALSGALQYAQPWAAAHPDRKTIVVLATDGDPSGCNANSVQDVANIAAAALNNNPPVKTFVVGVGSSLTSLNAIAAAGGTGQALIVDAAGGDPTQQFIDAMNKIRDQTTTKESHIEKRTTTVSKPVPCEWVIPATPDGKKFDKTKVNVEYSDGIAPAQRVGAVASEAECANVDQGWYYDDPSAPTKVLVCPQTCQTVQAITDADVQVVFGCATEIAVPR